MVSFDASILVLCYPFGPPREESSELGPEIRRAHIDAADGLDARPRRVRHDEVADFARLYTAPDFLFRRHEDAEIKWVHGNRDLQILKFGPHAPC
jgi:hypothetical protein